MNKKVVSGLAVAAALILVLAVLYYLFMGKSPETGLRPVPAPVAPGATAPAKPAAPAAAPTQPTPREQPAAPGIEPAVPPQAAAPSPEPQVTVLPPLEPSPHYGILVDSYGKYGDAAGMLARLKKQGKPAFIQRDPKDVNRFQVWLGPFSSEDQAREAAKSLQAILKQPLKIEPIENPVPK